MKLKTVAFAVSILLGVTAAGLVGTLTVHAQDKAGKTYVVRYSSPEQMESLLNQMDGTGYSFVSVGPGTMQGVSFIFKHK